MIKSHLSPKSPNFFKYAVLLGLYILIVTQQLTIGYMVKATLKQNTRLKTIEIVQEFELKAMRALNQKYEKIAFINKTQKVYNRVKEEGGHNVEKRIITSIIESVYPGITDEWELSTASDAD